MKQSDILIRPYVTEKALNLMGGSAAQNYKDGNKIEFIVHRDADKADIKAANRESLERLLKENYIDILKNNYIYLQSTNEKGTKIYWAIYHVDIDDETWKNVLSSVNDKYAYYMIRVNVSLIGSGKSKGKNSRLRNRLLRDISKKITPFAIHGQVTREGGFGAYVGESSGIRHNDRMFIYRQKGEGENARSVKVATARVTNTNLEECKLYTIAGGFANSKKGDIAVLREDTRNNLSIYGLLEKDAYTANFMYDHAANYTSIGTATHFLLHLGAGVFKNYNDYKYAVPLKEYNGNTYVFHAPVIVQLGVGFGYSWTALHRFNGSAFWL